MEALGGFDGVLAGEAVGDEQNFARLGDLRDGRGLIHHLVVERGAPGGVEDENVVTGEACLLERALGDVLRALAGDDRQHIDANGFAERGQLLHRSRTARVKRGHQHALFVRLGQTVGDLRGGGGFARSLQAGHHDDVRRLASDPERFGRAVAAERRDQLVMDDLDDLLTRLHRLDDAFADCLDLHLGDEVLHHRQRDVGFQQRHAHFAQGSLDVRFTERAAPGELVEDA